MWRLIFVVAPLLAGCGALRDHAAHVGWRFEVLKPPTISTEALVNSSGQTLGILGAGSAGLRSEVSGLAPVAPPLPSAVEVGPPIEWESLRASIAMILRRLDTVERATLPPVPPSKSAPETLKCPKPST